MQLSHFAGMVVFALLVSVAFASLGQRNLAGRIRHAGWCLLLFMAVALGVAWLLFPFSR
jgi:hypothetical protein